MLSEAGNNVAPLLIFVSFKARIYNLYPFTSVEVTVTVPDPVASKPPEIGVIGIFIFPLVAIEREVKSPYGRSVLYKPFP